MKNSLLPIFLVSILFSCTRTADIESVSMSVETPQQTVLPKISKDVDFLSADDAVKVANLFNHGNVLTKSETLKEVRDVVPVKDDSGRTLMYAVNYADGYDLISATKKYHPVLAMVEHGTYTGEKTNTGYDVIMNEYVEATQAAIDGKIKIDGNPWAVYEDISFEAPVQTKVSDEYYDVVNQYTGEWYQAGYNIYYLREKPDNMPDEMYEQFCDYASEFDRQDHDYMQCSFIVEENYSNTTTVGPLCSTSWGQKFPYNMSMADTSLPLGCTTIAAAQIMKAIEYPTCYDWQAFPNTVNYFYPTNPSDTLLSDFLVALRANIGVNSQGEATLQELKQALKNHYAFNWNWSLNIVNHDNANIVASLDDDIPVCMTGLDENTDDGHAWVCDGYRSVVDYTRYSLFVIPMDDEITELLEWERQDCYRGNTFTYHMNWGWKGAKDGYYLDHRLNMTLDDDPVNFSQDRKDLIFSR